MSEIIINEPQGQRSAGIDVGKAWLDIALPDRRLPDRQRNTAEGHAAIAATLKELGVTRVGLEASGGYEGAVVAALRAEGFGVQLFQPIQVKAYARFRLQRAKRDRIDCLIIAQCTASLTSLRDPPDARLAPFARRLTMIEQIEEDIARAKVRREHAIDDDIRLHFDTEIKRLRALCRAALKCLETDLRQQADLNAKLDLITGIDGVGIRTAMAMVVMMPELGQLTREQAASLLGVAPFVRQSGKYEGERHVEGGRARPRTALFACAQAAILHNKDLRDFYDRLRARGRHHSCAVMACTRKLVVIINAVIKRGHKWIPVYDRKIPTT